MEVYCDFFQPMSNYLIHNLEQSLSTGDFKSMQSLGNSAVT